jgi:hypothetical protein
MKFGADEIVYLLKEATVISLRMSLLMRRWCELSRQAIATP